MAQTIELAQVREHPYHPNLSCPYIPFLDREERLSESIGKEIPRSLAIRKIIPSKCTSCCRHLGFVPCGDHGQVSKMVWQFPFPLYEWQSPSGACIHHLQNRICCWLSAYVRQTSSVSSRFSRHWDAHQGAQNLKIINQSRLGILSLIRLQQTKSFVR